MVGSTETRGHRSRPQRPHFWSFVELFALLLFLAASAAVIATTMLTGLAAGPVLVSKNTLGARVAGS